MESGHDDLLAIVATLTGKQHSEVFKMALTLGMRRFNYWVDQDLVRKLLFNLSTLASSDYKDFTAIDALPDVCILCVDYDDKTESNRHVLWHHVKGRR